MDDHYSFLAEKGGIWWKFYPQIPMIFSVVVVVVVVTGMASNQNS